MIASRDDLLTHAIGYRVYPLGFCGAYPADPAPVADEHRLLRLIPWLDHIIELGCSVLALGPIFASTSHGYDTVDFFQIDPRLGTEGDFDTLVAECRRRDLKVQLDGVFNHVGAEHPWVVDVRREGLESPSSRLLRAGSHEGQVWFHNFEGHDTLVTLDHSNPAVVDEVVRVMRHWLDRGADAWRLDAAYAVPNEFWATVLPQVRESHPSVWFEGEVIHGDYAGFVAESSADTVTQYELWKAIWSSFKDRNFFELDHALGRHNALLETFAPATFLGNHDTTRIASQVARADVPSTVALLALLGGMPTIYAGDELGWAAVKEERAGGDDAVRPEFPRSPAEVGQIDEAILGLYRDVIGVRRRHPWLHRARSVTEHLTNTELVLRLDEPGGAGQLRIKLRMGEQPEIL